MTIRRGIRTWLPAATIVAASLTCRGDISDPQAEPAALVEVAGDGQVGLINSVLPQALVVRVVDAEGQPVSGVEVEWTVGGGGSVSQSSVVSENDGLAAVQRTLGGTAGSQTTTASVANLAPVLFTSTAEAGEVPRLVVTTEPSATAESGVPLVRQPVLRAEDGTGEPLAPGVSVTVSVSSGATLSGTTPVASEGAGLVRFTDLALSGPDGNYVLTFSAPGLAGVQSAAIALGGTGSDRLVVTIQPSNVAESGVELTQQPVVTAETAAGEPLSAGIPVTVSLSSGATLAGTTAVETDGSGVATFTDLALTGPDGSYTLTFSAPDLEAVESESITLATISDEGGVWSEPVDWPIVAVHLMLLPNGQVLSIGRAGQPHVWNPEDGTFTQVSAPALLFCAGHALLSDGRVFVAGGHIDIDAGLPNITFFSDGNTWTSGTPMAQGRWYPTTTVLGNGDVVILAGKDESKAEVPIPEVWSNGSLRQLTGASYVFPYYPRAFLAPDGSVYVAGATAATRFLSVSGGGSWRVGPRRPGGARNYGSAVMYDDGRILYAGGAYTTNTAEVIDLNLASSPWRATGSMAFARRHLNLTVLPTGEVLATGGVNGTEFNDVSRPVRAAELWNPATGQWTTLASSAVTRGYHASSLLLPDGRVLHSGSGDGGGAPRELNAELFSPPYLFRGARPQITSAPAEVRYGNQFRVLTPQAGAITQVSLIRLGAVTHAFDQNQRFQRLGFTADATGLTVTAPSSGNRAPPGHYMVFILNGAGVPSIARIVRIF